MSANGATPKRRNYRHLDVRPFAPNLGAEVRGIDLADGLTENGFEEVHDAFLDHRVLFFKEQSPIPPDRHVAIGRMFGELHRCSASCTAIPLRLISKVIPRSS